ncbi:helix-turn-helix domain-containing protein [Adhaeribacter pallidiroseus]|uniref:HTH-type transcriptional regulator AlkR n=1 Tax=Adhaeribacter pallidiroseus TaxID=2072847 RepID=A0A369QCA7_9BACT|nr:AraC family transcriptional regulator [Adhaeribacter pallidiroseus]RDC62521.1 HTH-type transcriptional regulator AlkR [Adhaeribacter pallidiroseus]
MVENILKFNFSLLNTDYVQLDKSWNYPNVTSIFYRLYYIDQGEGLLTNATQKVKLEPGFLYLIPSFTTCNYYCDSYLSQYYISFSEEFSAGASLFFANRKLFKIPASNREVEAVKRIVQLNPGRDLRKSDDPRIYEKSLQLKEFQELNNALPAPAFMETCGLLLLLVSRFMASDDFLTKAITAVHSKVAEAIQHIHTNLSTPITVDLLAKRASQHPDYFSRLFQENTGMRPLAYLQMKRVERAQLLIATTDLPFYEIANQTGFDSLSYFSRLFRSLTGMAPGAYKKLNRNHQI